MQIRKLTTLALYTTLALIIYSVESLMPPPVPIPGIKLGLSNIITLVVLTKYSSKDTLLLLTARILLSTFLFGQAMSLLYSLAGGLLSFVTMVLVQHLLQKHFIYLTAIVGALFHNIGQLLVAFLITSVPGVLTYLPFLIVSAVLTGLFTGLCAHFTLKYFTKHTS